DGSSGDGSSGDGSSGDGSSGDGSSGDGSSGDDSSGGGGSSDGSDNENEDSEIDTEPVLEEEIDDDDCDTSKEDLQKVFPNMSDSNAELLAHLINEKGADFGIDSDIDLWHFLSQAAAESGFESLNVMESLNYSTASLLPKRYSKFTMDSIAASQDSDLYYAPDYVGNPTGVANVAYCCVFSNGDVASGDGNKYRGKGLMQLTWKSNYIAFKNFYNEHFDPDIDPVTYPEIIASNDTLAILSGLWVYKTKVVDRITPLDSTTTVKDVTIKINGKSALGLDKRENYFQKVKDSINCL
ncbi:glycoside hydrolase family 19 protein, partial [Neptunitalea chrysea]|uniref:glycoside hydrolase family 19 protein n=1 Tax=Neptunitalea chrysea TaxID=1647581 RepID=UPI002490DA35